MPAIISTQATPSSSALWASIGPSITSPIAKIPSILVSKSSSTIIWPRSVSETPSLSRPSCSVAALRPTDTSAISQAISRLLLPSASLTVKVTPLAVALADVTAVELVNFKPCFVINDLNFVATSLSIPGKMRGKYSITSTSAPNRDQTQPISRPI